MEKILEKLSSYNIFNYLFPGVVFCVISDRYFSLPLLQESIIEGLFLYYFIGLIISRFGSLVVEPLFKRFGIVDRCDYSDFIKASKADPKIELLSETNNMYRTIFSGLIILCILIASNQFTSGHPDLTPHLKYVLLAMTVTIFGFSYKKQTDYITKRTLTNNDT
ncbi:hypothetical protein ACJJIX_04155 [Microbulbifer sp. VAAC004]|uniref:hypothetical protein n=1 Tax=unclassified Microbulbifer TaxID=2619833 RepID=UPI004039BFCC